MPDGEADFRYSAYRERVLEHQLMGEILRDMWLRGAYSVEILRAEVDGAGYDVVLEYDSIIRHVQLKATRKGGSRARVGVNTMLRNKPSGCVVWFTFDPRSMRPAPPYLWLGGKPGERLPELGERRGRHTKGDSRGRKAVRESIREVTKSRFDVIDTIPELSTRLFGSPQARGHS